MQAHLRKIRISPKKVNVLAEIIRDKDALIALDILKFTPQKAAKLLYKVLNSAVSNAEKNFQKESKDLWIKEIIVNKGPSFRRNIPSARGRALPITKPTTHISVILSV